MAQIAQNCAVAYLEPEDHQPSGWTPCAISKSFSDSAARRSRYGSSCRAGERAAVLAHLLGRQLVDVRAAVADERQRVLVELVK